MDKSGRKRTFVNFAFVEKVDLFREALPQFNLKGKSSVGTIAGGLISIGMLYVTFLFGCTKLLYLVEQKNPTVNTYPIIDAFANEDRFSL